MNVRGNILVADDDAAIRTVLNQALTRVGHDVRVTSNASTLWRWVAAGEGDLVITDVVMPDENAFDMLPRIKKARPELPVIVMSAQNTFMTAIRASETGAYEYLPKPFDLTELINIVNRALSEPKRPQIDQRADEQPDAMPLVGRSAAMQDIYRMLARMMQTDLTVMISGESGTGKELVARALHEYGRRRNGPFVAINMAAIPRDLIELELFGHEKGAFTGAQQRSTGRFEQAEGGTLFLDEIGDMPMEAQTRLLRVLQQGEYTTVGGRTPIKTDVRIVAATNKDLRTLINQGLFREDLFYRLNVVPLRLPALRERSEDIPDLVRHFFKQGENSGLQTKRISEWRHRADEALPLAGQRARAGKSDSPAGRALPAGRDFGRDHRRRAEDRRAAGRQPGHLLPDDLSIGQAVEHYLQRYFGSFAGDLPPPGLYQRILAEVEYPLVLASMTATRGNQIKAAELLGLNRNTLRKKIRELGVNVYRAELTCRNSVPLETGRFRDPFLISAEECCTIATMRCIHPTHCTGSQGLMATIQRCSRADLCASRHHEGRRLLVLTGVVAIVGALISAAVSFAILVGVTPITPDNTTTLTLIAVNAGFVLLLIGLIGRELRRIYVARRRGKAASRLHVRIVTMFALVAAIPAIMVAVVASITLDIGLDRWFEIRTKTIISSSLSIADAYVQENARNLQGTTLSMAYDLDQARSIYSLDRTGFRDLMTQQALGRKPRPRRADQRGRLGHHRGQDTTPISICRRRPPEWVASAASGQPVLIEPAAQPGRRDRQDARDPRRLSLHDQAGRP